MNILSRRHLRVLVILLAFLARGTAGNPFRSAEKEGKLVVRVAWGDVYNTPATDVYVEAYGFVSEYGANKSFVLRSSRAGEYQTSLPAGVYDVFVSDTISVPICKRVLIKAGSTTTWSQRLEIDYVYSQK